MSKATGHFSSLKHSQTLSTFNFIARKATGSILIKVLKTSWGSYRRSSLTASVEMKSPYAGRVKGIKGFEHIPPKNVKIQIKQSRCGYGMTRSPIPSGIHLRMPSQPDFSMFLSFSLCSCKFLYPKREHRNFSAVF